MDQPSGTFEICLKPIYAHSWDRAVQQMHLPMVAFCVGAGFLVFRLYLKRTHKHLGLAPVVPGRIETVLDVLSDGVVMTDEKGRILFANKAFQKAIDQSGHSLLGKSLSTFNWMDPTGNLTSKDLPWIQALQNGSTHSRLPLILEHTDEPGLYRNVLVSAIPITGTEGENRGTLVSFADVLQLESADREFVEVTRLADTSDIATELLDDDGKIVSRVNVSTTLLLDKLAHSKSSRLQDVARMITDHHDDLGHFSTKAKRDQHMPAYLIEMIDLLLHEQIGTEEIVSDLKDQINDLGEIVKNQKFTSNTSEQGVEHFRHDSQIWQPGSAIFGGKMDHEGTTGPNNAAQAIFEAKQTKILADTQILGPQWESYYAQLIKKETEGLPSVPSEKQNGPIDPSQGIIKLNDPAHREDPRDSVANFIAMPGDTIRVLGASYPSLERNPRGDDGDIGHANTESKQRHLIPENLLSRPAPRLKTALPTKRPSPKRNKHASRPPVTAELRQTHPIPENVPSAPAPIVKTARPARSPAPKRRKQSGLPLVTVERKLTRRGRGVLNSEVKKYIQDRGIVPGITWEDVVTAINTMDRTRHAPTSRQSVEKTRAWREYLSGTDTT